MGIDGLIAFNMSYLWKLNTNSLQYGCVNCADASNNNKNNNKNFILPEVHINITVLNRKNREYWLLAGTLELKMPGSQ